MATIRYYAKHFPNLALKETTVRRIKNVYLSELKKGPFETSYSSQLGGDSKVVQQLFSKKKGHPLLLEEELGKQVCDYLMVLELHDLQTAALKPAPLTVYSRLRPIMPA